MGRVERAPRLVEHRDGALEIERPVTLDELAEVGALDVPHRDVGDPARLPGVVDRDDVRVVDPGHELRLADEPLPEVAVLGQLGRERLQRGLAAEQRVRGLVDEPHAAAAEEALDAVRAELAARLEVLDHRAADPRGVGEYRRCRPPRRPGAMPSS